MKKLFLGIMCIMLVAGCTTTNDKKVIKSSTDQVQEVKKVDEQKTDQTEQEKTVDKKEETKTENKNKTETVKKEEKKEEQKKTTSQKTTTKKKTNTTKKKTTKKKTTTKKKKTNSISSKPINYHCLSCGYECKTEKEILKHLDESDDCWHYGIDYETTECPDDWVFIE